MKGRGSVSGVVMGVLVLGMLMGQSSAKFRSCYGKCLLGCMIKPPFNAVFCGTKCLRRCILPAHAAPHDFCKLGCASSFCTNITNEQDFSEEKVEGCVGSCSETCAKNYSLP